MTVVWFVDTQRFYNNVLKVIQNNQIMALIKNNAYHYGLEFAVQQFLVAGINTFSTTSLREAIRIRQLAPNATIFLMNAVYEFDKVRDYQIQMTLPSLNFYYEHIKDLQGIQ